MLPLKDHYLTTAATIMLLIVTYVGLKGHYNAIVFQHLGHWISITLPLLGHKVNITYLLSIYYVDLLVLNLITNFHKIY
jgi:hypothetical protein